MNVFQRCCGHYGRGKSAVVLCLLVICVGVGVYVFLDEELVPDFVRWYPNNVTYDGLPPGEDLEPPENSIFFHETSSNSDLNHRQACSVETAARSHPNWTVHVLFLSQITGETIDNGTIKVLKQFQNVKFYTINLHEYVKGTLLEKLVYGGALERSMYQVSHTSDVLRYLTLHKWGGVYFDLDVIVTRPLEFLGPNWVARESDENIASCALAFSRDENGRQVSEATVKDIQRQFRGDVWGHNGPGVITRVLRKRCGVQLAKDMSREKCHGISVYGPNKFYPVPWPEWRKYFEPGDLNTSDTYVHHVWNRKSYYEKVPSNAPYAKLAEKYCPSVYEIYKGDF